MRLPGLEYKRGVGSGGKVDPYAPIALGRSISRLGANVGQAAESWKTFAEGIEKRRDDLDVKESTNRTDAEMGKWEEWAAANPYLAFKDIPPDVREKLGLQDKEFITDKYGNSKEVSRKQIPMYEVYAELKLKKMEGTFKDASMGIRNKNLRAAWVADSEGVINASYGKAVVSGVQEALKASMKKELDMYENAVNQGRFDYAAKFASTMNISNENKQLLRMQAFKAKENNLYNQALTTEIHTESTAAWILFLRDDVDPNNGDYTGHFTSNERKATWKLLDGKLNTHNRVLAAKGSAGNAMEVDNARKLITHAAEGRPLDAVEAMQLHDKVWAHNPVVARQLLIAIDQQPEMARYAASPDVVTGKGIAELGRVRTGEGEVALGTSMAIASKTKLTEQYNKNEVQFVLDKNIFSGAQKINFNEPAKKQAGSHDNRSQLLDAMYQMYGKESNSYFTDQEQEDITVKLSDMADLKDKLNFMEGLSIGMDERYRQMAFEQLKLGGMDNTIVMTGELLGHGKKPAAIANLYGWEKRKQNKDLIRNEIEFKDVFRDETKSAFFENETRKSALYQTSLNIYAYGQDLNGNVTGEWEEDDYRTAIRRAMSDFPVLEYGENSSIIPPDPYMTKKQLKTQLDFRLSDEGLAGVKLDGISPYQLRNEINNGTIRLINDDSRTLIAYRPGLGDGVRLMESGKPLFTIDIDPEWVPPTKETPVRDFIQKHLSGKIDPKSKMGQYQQRHQKTEADIIKSKAKTKELTKPIVEFLEKGKSKVEKFKEQHADF